MISLPPSDRYLYKNRVPCSESDENLLGVHAERAWRVLNEGWKKWKVCVPQLLCSKVRRNSRKPIPASELFMTGILVYLLRIENVDVQ